MTYGTSVVVPPPVYPVEQPTPVYPSPVYPQPTPVYPVSGPAPYSSSNFI